MALKYFIANKITFQWLHNTQYLPMKILNWILILPIKFYRMAISPLIGSSCRYQPTCSKYTMDAINEWGAFKGSWLGIKRITSCHPWGGHGWDPVPKKDEKGNKHTGHSH